MSSVMIDIETLDIHPGGLILSIGAVHFGSHCASGNGKQLYCNVDVLSSLMAGFTVDPKTVAWWNEQSKEATGIFRQSPFASITMALKSLSELIGKDDLVWAKGPDFDLVLLTKAYEMMGVRVPWSFRNARDVRTMIWLGKLAGLKESDAPKPQPFIKHFALHDAMFQAEVVLQVANELGVYV